MVRDRKPNSKKPLWLLLDGPMDQKWTETVEMVIASGHMNLHSGEEMDVSGNMQLLFETSSIAKVVLYVNMYTQT